MPVAETETPETPAPAPPEQPQPTPPEQPSPPPSEPPSPPAAGGAAETRIRELNKRATEAERKLREIEERDLSEQQKAVKRAEAAEKRAADAERAAARMTRERWAETAAAQMGFRRAEDAVLRLDLDNLDTEAKVRAEVKKLAERADLRDLLGAGGAPAPQAFGHMGGQTPPPPGAEAQVPVGEDGKPDHKLGLGQELLRSMGGR